MRITIRSQRAGAVDVVAAVLQPRDGPAGRDFAGWGPRQSARDGAIFACAPFGGLRQLSAAFGGADREGIQDGLEARR